MHLLLAQSGAIADEGEAIDLGQSPGDICVLSAADTELAALAAAQGARPDDAPTLRLASLMRLAHPMSMDQWIERTGRHAKLIVARVLGGRGYFQYGLDALHAAAKRHGVMLVALPGDAKPDPELARYCTVDAEDAGALWRHLVEGGTANAARFLDHAGAMLGRGERPGPPEPLPAAGLWSGGRIASLDEVRAGWTAGAPTVAVTFYRALVQGGQTAPIDALCEALRGEGLNPLPVFAASLKDAECQATVRDLFARVTPRVVLNATAFAISSPGAEHAGTVLDEGGAVVLQVVLSGSPREVWAGSSQGMTARDLAMNVALPEVDGRVLTRAVAFKRAGHWDERCEIDLVRSEPEPGRIAFVAELARRWATMPPVAERRVAVVLANYPTRDGRIGNGVGLDTPAGTVVLLEAMRAAGYRVADVPPDGNALVETLLEGRTNGSVGVVRETLTMAEYRAFFDALPASVREAVTGRWGAPEEDKFVVGGNNRASPPSGSAARSDERSIAATAGLGRSNPLGLSSPAVGGGDARGAAEGGRDVSPVTKARRSSDGSAAPLRPGDAGPPPPTAGEERFGTPLPIDSAMDNREEPSGASTGTAPAFALPILRLGNVAVGIQPARGYGVDPKETYHSPDLVPPHGYIAFYAWLRREAHAIVHMGKHGNMEWLPGKALALSDACFPETVFGPTPHVYPFIVNDPGEGAQAKRRAQAVIVDHLTPPLTRAEAHGPMRDLEALVDEYFDASGTDPRRTKLLGREIADLARSSGIAEDVGIAGDTIEGDALEALDAWLCELKELQIRDGLHVFGRSPEGRLHTDLLCALARVPRGGGEGDTGLTRALADDLELDLDPLDCAMGERWDGARPDVLINASDAPWRTAGDTVERLELLAAALVDGLDDRTSVLDGEHRAPPPSRSAGHLPLGGGGTAHVVASRPDETFEASTSSKRGEDRSSVGTAAMLRSSPLEGEVASRGDDGGGAPAFPNLAELPRTAAVLHAIHTRLAPAIDACGPREIAGVLTALDGRFVAPGPSGAPTRGRADVLPTGRNFYSVDTRAVPTPAAWTLGAKSAELVVVRHLQDQGDWPRAVGLTCWGTACMRTGGDDIAQAMALIGARPVWDGASRRVTGYEIITLAELGRPRVDVTLRVSGFFRDAFPDQIALFDRAARAVGALDEPDDQNPIASRMREERAALVAGGASESDAARRAGYRVFGSKPGAYGAGLQALIDEGGWERRDDLAEAYTVWGGYAYGAREEGVAEREGFERRLGGMEAVLHNQDNREQDLLDSDDYYQFEGGMSAAVERLRGEVPRVYHNDHSRPESPRVRTLDEEIARVVRGRVTNPKWIAGVMRHGYKGAFEIAATVDYLFAFAATTNAVREHHFDTVHAAFIEDDAVRDWMAANNPNALRETRERLAEAIERGLWHPRSNSARAALMGENA